MSDRGAARRSSTPTTHASSSRSEHVRNWMLAAVALVGVGVSVWTGYGTAQLTQRQAERDRQTAVAGRFSQSVEELGSASADVRLGAIYAMEKLATVSPDYRSQVRDLLVSYLHAHAPLRPKDSLAPKANLEDAHTLPRTAPHVRGDIIGAFVVLGHLGIDPPTEDEVLASRLVPFTTYRLEGVNMDRRDFTGEQLPGAALAGVSLDQAVFRLANLEGADLRHTSMYDTDLTGARLEDAQLYFTDATDAQLQVFADDVRLAHSILSRADLSHSRLRGGDLRWAAMDAADLTRTDLTDANLARADLSQAHGLRTMLAKGDLTMATMYGTRLNNANLHQANLSRARISDVSLTGANLADAVLEHAKGLSGDLRDANLNRADLQHSFLATFDLRHANLQFADLADAYLGNANLTGANLTAADLRGATLTGANLASANLEDAYFDGTTRCDHTTTWPFGHPPSGVRCNF